jgi:hypothetical protein
MDSSPYETVSGDCAQYLSGICHSLRISWQPAAKLAQKMIDLYQSTLSEIAANCGYIWHENEDRDETLAEAT